MCGRAGHCSPVKGKPCMHMHPAIWNMDRRPAAADDSGVFSDTRVHASGQTAATAPSTRLDNERTLKPTSDKNTRRGSVDGDRGPRRRRPPLENHGRYVGGCGAGACLPAYPAGHVQVAAVVCASRSTYTSSPLAKLSVPAGIGAAPPHAVGRSMLNSADHAHRCTRCMRTLD